jgi:HK97 family phage major capsid protein
MPTLVELNKDYDVKCAELAKIYGEAKTAEGTYDFTKASMLSGDSAARVEEVRRRNDELGELHKQIEEQAEYKRQHDALARSQSDDERPAGGLPHPGGATGGGFHQVRSLNQLLAESKEYQTFRERKGGTAVIELSEAEYEKFLIETNPQYKALLTLSNINVQATRRPGILDMAQEERSVRDLLLEGTMDGNALEYYEETTFTNNAAEVAEGGTKPEGALGFTLRTDNARKIATWIPATDELLSDVRGMESYIRGRLSFMIRQRENLQLLVGDGIAPNILGIHNRTNVQTQAKGADPTPDAIYKGMQKIRVVAFSEPTAVVFHPNDWTDIRLLRTADGLYIWGSPADPGPDRIWGLPILQTTQEPENTALVGAFRPHAQVFQREGITITISTEHSTYFVENKIAILAEERLALAVYRPTAFCTVTGV